MIRRLSAAFAAFTLAGCAAQIAPPVPVAQRGPVEVQILAFNDFHGNLQTPDAVEIAEPDGTKHKVMTGGAAHLAAALAGLRAGRAYTMTVSAGDTIGAGGATFAAQPATARAANAAARRRIIWREAAVARRRWR